MPSSKSDIREKVVEEAQYFVTMAQYAELIGRPKRSVWYHGRQGRFDHAKVQTPFGERLDLRLINNLKDSA